MIELRWVVFGPNRQLEYRVMTPSVDASGAFCPGPGWSHWKVVPKVDGDDAAREDVIASGGLPEAVTPNAQAHPTASRSEAEAGGSGAAPC